ncbi:MAG TPA: gliding motility-associated C-terminal domain-containing protein [Saprospiraceae bacterium]|nr:gliding motility-associated C-terminal domain-containing protein [Saprospiraceae bacterium]
MIRPDQKLIYKFTLTIFFVVNLSLYLNSQCACTNCPVTLPTSGTAEGFLTISGATSGTLNTTQFVKAVNINVDHDALRECEITLIAPNGSSVLLSDNSGVAVNNNIGYNICILDCTGSPVPDPGFPINFTSNSNYMSGQTYTGSYYTYNGGCLSTLTGPVDGQWTLRFQDFIGGDGGTLNDWSIELANNDGTSCTFACATPSPACNAYGTLGSFNNAPQAYCLGTNLDLNIEWWATPPLDPNQYSIIWLLQNTTNSPFTIEYTTDQVFNNLPVGSYSLCGLAYLTSDAPLLPPINGTDLTMTIQNLINSGDFCGTFGTNGCFGFTIDIPLDLPLSLDGPEIVCAGELVTYTVTNPYGDDIGPSVNPYAGEFSTFDENGEVATITWETGPANICVDYNNACGVLQDCIDVNVFDYNFNSNLLGEMMVCVGNTETYMINPVLPPGYTSSFTVNCGDITAQSDNSITVLWNISGSCQLCYVITDPCGVSETTCQSILVNEPAPPVIFMNATACVNGSFTASIDLSPLYTSYNWSSTPAIINSGQGTSSITLSSLSTGTTTVCIEVTSDCGPPQSSCQTIEITDPPVPEIVIQNNCGLELNASISFPILDAVIVWTQVSGPGVLTFDPPGDDSVIVTASQPGTYVIQVTETLDGCVGTNTISVTFLPVAIVDNVILGNVNVCIGQSETYTLDPLLLPGFTNSWTVSNGFVTSQTENSVTVQWNTAGSGQICYNISDPCNDLTINCITVNINPSPPPPNFTFSAFTCVDAVFQVLLDSPNLYTSYTWTVTPGTIISGQGTQQISATSPVSGNTTICVETTSSCGPPQTTCQDIIIIQPAIPVITTTDLCGLSGTVTATDPGGAAYNWTQLSGPGTIIFSNPNNATTDVTASLPGTYVLQVEQGFGGCVGINTISITFVPVIVVDNVILGDILFCEGENETYTLSPGLPPGFTNTWTVINGVITSQTESDATVQWNNSGSGQICYNITDPCNEVETNCLNVTVIDLAPPPIINLPSSACISSNFQASLSDAASYSTINWTVNPGTILSGQGSGQISITTSSTATITVCVDVTSECSPPQSICQDIQIIDIPTPNISSISQCGLSAILEVTVPNGFSTYNWLQISGPGILNFNAQNSISTEVNATLPGTYTVQLSETLNGCTGINTIIITFLPNLLISNPVFDCNNANGYTFSFNISGGLPPYSVDNNTFTGNTFTSTLIPFGNNYSFVINDSEDCEITLSGSQECPCVSDAGFGSNQLIEVCEDQLAVGSVATGTFLDFNDIGFYVLHDNPGNILGSIFSSNVIPEFIYIPTLQYGFTYYISYVVGNDIGGTVDLSDPCLSISSGQPVIFNQIPNPNAGIDLQVCGNTFTLNGSNSVTGSTTNWSVLSGSNIDIDFPELLSTQVTLNGMGVYQFLLEENNQGCLGTDIVEVQIFDALTTQTTSVDCDPLDGGYTVTFSISGGQSPYIVNGDPIVGNNYTSSLITSGTPYNFDIGDGINCSTAVQGIFNCDCNTQGGTMESTELIVCAEGGSVTAIYNNNGILDADDVGMYVLHTSASNILGNVLATNQTGIFVYQPSFNLNTRYYISYVIGNNLNGNVDLSDLCLGVSPGQPVIFRSNPLVTINPVSDTCALTNIVSINPQSGTNYSWSSSNPNLSFSNQNGLQSLVTASTFGSYEVTLIANNDVCSDTSTLDITFKQPVSFGPILYDCQDVVSFSTTISILGSAPFTSNISSTEVTPNQLLFENLPSGNTTQVTITSINGCSNSANLTFNCACQSTAGTMSNVLLTACEGQSINAVYNFDGILGEVDSFIYILHTSPTTTLGTILETSADGSFTKTPNIAFGTTYYISYVSVNYENGNYAIQPCSFVTEGQPVVFYQNPTLTWDVIVAPCTPNGDFDYSTTSVNITNFELTLFPQDAFVVVNFLGIVSDKAGIYTASLDVEENGCVTTFTKTFELFDGPVINNIFSDCTGFEFNTSFEISGGTAPYFLNGDTPITSPYVSENFASLTNFSFFVEDDRGCATPLIVETKECVCITDAGTLNSGNLTLCEGEDLSPTIAENFTLDNGDSFEYILHDGEINSIGNILVRTKTFPIPFEPSYAGNSYILTRIVGQSDPNGEINIAGECTDVSLGIRVKWTSKPGITISLDEYTCEESPIFFNILNPAGGLLEVTINQSIVGDFGFVDGRLVLINENLKNGDILKYTFTDDFGCKYDLGSDVLDIRDKPNAGTDDQSFATCNNLVITVNLNDFINFADQGGQWYLRDFLNPIPTILNLDENIKDNFKAYYVVNNECGSDTSTVEGIRQPLPEFELDITDPLCFGQSDGTINIIPLDLTQDVNYSLNGTPLNNLTIENLPAGQFTILAVNSFTCSVEQMIDLNPPVAFEIDLGLDITIDQGETVEVDFTSNLAFEDILSTIWSLPNGQIITEKLSGVTFIGDVSGQVSLEIVDNNGCLAQDSLQIKVNEITTEIVLPNIILPGSTTNGLFTITNNTAIEEVTTCAIYDRWGNNVYSIDKVLPALVVWDGSFKGADCQPGVYIYKIALKLINGKEKILAGDITVLR